jgi:hypothetical protein
MGFASSFAEATGGQIALPILQPVERLVSGLSFFIRSCTFDVDGLKKVAVRIPFMVRYLTTDGISAIYGLANPFTLRYRRVNATFYEGINVG